MKRTRTAALLLATTVAGSGLLGAVGSASAADAGTATHLAASAPASSSWGWTKAADHQLDRGCHSYPFHYSVNAPSDSWMAELRLVGPHGAHVASHTFINGSYSRSGLSHWKVCSTNAATGVYSIKMKVTNYDEYSGDATARQVRTTHFRLTAR